jgi:hypothetical protein
MKTFHSIRRLLPGLLLVLGSAACGVSNSSSQPAAAVAPITIGNDLSQIDVCQAIPKEEVESVMGRKLIGNPERFEFTETPGETSGCIYYAEQGADGEAHFGYVVLTPLETYSDQPLSENTDVSGIGDKAYFNNGADARQLWVRLNNKVAFVVAFGDTPNEEGAKTIARLLVAAIQ